MEKSTKPIKSIPNRSKKEWATQGIKAYIMLMLEFLRISPSYALADRMVKTKMKEKDRIKAITDLYQKGNKQLLTTSEIAELVADFDKVLATYELYGDIATIKFDDWWMTKGIDIFGVDYFKPEVRQIARIEKNEKMEAMFHKALDHYFMKPRVNEGKPPALILSIPLNMNKKYLLTQVSKLIDRANASGPVKPKKAYKRLAATRLRSEPLMKMIQLLWHKAYYPNMEQWRIAVKTKMSETYSPKLDGSAKTTKLNTEERYNLNVLTTRMLTKAKLAAENAARDVFPSFEKRILPHFDYDDVYERLRLAKPTLRPRKAVV